jgi:hypothetical protein
LRLLDELLLLKFESTGTRRVIEDLARYGARLKGELEDFERTLLLTQSGALNQLRFLAQALADAEGNPARRNWVLGVRREFDRIYVEIVALLDKRFFRPPASTPTGAAGR